jgi:hypothetical protein
MRKTALSATLLLCARVAFSLDPALAIPERIPLNGLTGTLENIIKSRPNHKIAIGSYSVLVDDLVDDDIAALITCDTALNAYLNESEECNYWQFSEIIRRTIADNFNDKSGFLHADVEASEEDASAIYISIAIEYGRTMLLPVHIETVDGELKVSFTVPCTVEYSMAVNFEIDSEQVLNGTEGQGVSIEIEYLTINLKTVDGEWNHKLDIVHMDNVYAVSISDFDVDASFNWYLRGLEGDDPDAGCLSYERLGNGEYSWQLDAWSGMSFSISTDETDDENILAIALRYGSDDLSASQDHYIEMDDGYEVSRVPIRPLEYQRWLPSRDL